MNRKYRATKNLTNVAGRVQAQGDRDRHETPVDTEPSVDPSTVLREPWPGHLERCARNEEGHDEDISREEIIAQGIVSEEDYLQLEKFTYALFDRGTAMAKEQGLILVDTKYEFGKKDGQIYLIDEIHTPDSSRYFYLEGYQERQQRGERQQQLSKEFVREWLMHHGFQGKEGQLMPVMPDSFVEQVSERYIELYERVTGKPFQKANTENMQQRIERNIIRAL